MTFLKNLWTDESGASAAEYALIAGAAILLGDTIAGAMSDATSCIETDGQTCP